MGNFDENYDEVKQSAFNEAAKKMSRFDNLQSLLNQVNINLTEYNPDFGVYNFEVKFDVINSLVLELCDKIGPDDEKDCHSLRDGIDDFMKKYPTIEIKRSLKIGNNGQMPKTNKDHFKALKIYLRIYESKVRKLIGKHGFSTRDKEGKDLF